MSGPLVSIVVPSYNQARYVERTVRSLLAQDYPRLEVIVLDAVSTDGSVDVLRRYADRLDVLIVEKDRGQADALDRGFRLARGQLLGYLNSDDVLAGPSTIAQVVEAFHAHPEADVVTGRRRSIDAEGHYLPGWPHRPFDAARLVRACYLYQEATFWTRTIYDRAGGHIDTSFDFAMDYDLWLRFLAVGARFVAIDQVWGLFRSYPDQKSQDRWKDVGLPEIARLQRRHLGRALPEQEMIDHYLAHFRRAHPVREASASTLFDRYWQMAVGLESAVLRRVPLDGWVHRAGLRAGRLAG